MWNLRTKQNRKQTTKKNPKLTGKEIRLVVTRGGGQRERELEEDGQNVQFPVTRQISTNKGWNVPHDVCN